MKAIVTGLAIVMIVGCMTPLRSHAGGGAPDARVAKGKVWFDEYCTPCHGSGGAPGTAVFAANKKPVDLRTIAQRSGGRFPSEKWWEYVFNSQPRDVHAEPWERIRNDQKETVEIYRDIAARGVAANIEYYVESIQNENE